MRYLVHLFEDVFEVAVELGVVSSSELYDALFLGLTLKALKQVVKDHGGSLQLVSTLKPNSVYSVTLDDYLEAVELGMTRGKLPGESLEAEIVEILYKRGKQDSACLGKIGDSIVGANLREQGIGLDGKSVKVLYLRDKDEV